MHPRETILEERHFDEERSGGRNKVNSLAISFGLGGAPLERCQNIRYVSSAFRGMQRTSRLKCHLLEIGNALQVVLYVAVGDVWQLSGFDELLPHIVSSRVEEPVEVCPMNIIGCDQRLCYKLRKG